MTKSWRDFLLETQKTFVRKKPITLFFLLGEVCLKEREEKVTETKRKLNDAVFFLFIYLFIIYQYSLSFNLLKSKDMNKKKKTFLS